MKHTIVKLLLVAAVIGLSLLAFGCKKDRKHPSHSVTFNCYSISVPYYFGYTDKNDQKFTETIQSYAYTKTFDVTDDQYSQQMGITKIGTINPDSLYVKAMVDGKVVEKWVVVNCPCSASAFVQLSNAK